MIPSAIKWVSQCVKNHGFRNYTLERTVSVFLFRAKRSWHFSFRSLPWVPSRSTYLQKLSTGSNPVARTCDNQTVTEPRKTKKADLILLLRIMNSASPRTLWHPDGETIAEAEQVEETKLPRASLVQPASALTHIQLLVTKGGPRS